MTNNRRKNARRVLPIIVAAALIAFVFWRLDWAAFRGAIARANLAAFVAFNLVFVASVLMADVFATRLVYRRVADVKYWRLLAVRGASYVPSLLNHHVGQAWLTYFLSTLHGISIKRIAGATLIVYASWAGCLTLVAAVALPAAGYSATTALVPLAAGVGYLIVVGLKPSWLARWQVFRPLFEAGVIGHVHAMVSRTPHVLVVFLGTWGQFLFFDVNVPLSAALTRIPILMVVVTLPLTPQGLGTRDAVAGSLLAAYAVGESQAEQLAAVAAATTSSFVCTTLASLVIGLAMMRPATNLLPRHPTLSVSGGASD